ncbi:EF-Tu/IF-2/RF-3 family GTPase, partial [Candidatus Omnitrophota bacterium]
PFQMLVTMLDHDSYVGLIAIGRIFHGAVSVGETIAVVKHNGTIDKAKVTKIMKYKGLIRVETDKAVAGDIITLAGMENVQVGETLACINEPKGLPTVKIDEPTISMNFSHNTSPLSGKDGGRFLTSRHIRERLKHEARINVGIKVEEVAGGERFKVSGRGELHLSILIETMRREGYEMEVSRPQVIFKKLGEEVLEPVEEIVIEVDAEYQGAVMQALGERKAETTKIDTTSAGIVRMDFIIASRALIGFRSDFLLMTRGSGIMYQNFLEYQTYKGDMPERQRGVLVSQSAGQAIAYALFNLQARGEIFISPGDDLYEGMVLGVNNKGADLVVNALKGKKLTNMRSSGSDEAIQLIPPREKTLEFALEFIEDDELVEITPQNIRIRKFHLSEQKRKLINKKK